MQKKTKRWLSALLSAVMLCTAVVPASVLAADTDAAEPGTLEIYDGETNVTGQGWDLMENDDKQLTAKYNGELPEGSSIVWDSAAQYAAYVSDTGLVTGRDASRRPVILAWINENIRPLWLIGPSLADSLTETVNGMTELDDPELVMDALHFVLDPVLGEGAATALLNPLENTLKDMKVRITATLVDAEGQEIASAETWVNVLKDDNPLSNIIPNGTYITNHEAMPAVVEKGYQVKLEAITTPLRLNMGVTWKVEELLLNGWLPIQSNKATFDENGVITFNEAGTVRITASPDVQGLMDKIEGYLTTIGDLANAADALSELIQYVFGDRLPMGVLDVILDIVIGIVDAGTGDTAHKIQEIASQVANWILQFTINDTITVQIVDQLDVTGFEIIGDTENVSSLLNATRYLTIGNIQPEGAVVGPEDIEWATDNRDLAVVGSDGKLTVRGPVSAWVGDSREFNVSATVDGVTVTKHGSVKMDNTVKPTDIEFTGPNYLEKGETGYYSYSVYPLALDLVAKHADVGILMPDGSVDYSGNANNGIIAVSGGNFISAGTGNVGTFQISAVGGGVTKLYLRSCYTHSIFYEMEITVHESVADLTIDQGDEMIVEVETTAGFGTGSTQLTATLSPETAINKAVTWTSDNDKIKVDENGVVSYNVMPLIQTLPASATITATSVDNPAVSDSITVTFTKATVHVTGVTLDRASVSMAEGATDKLTANIQPGDATVKDVTWSSSAPEVVTVDAAGNLTAVAPGDSVITVTTADGGFIAQCTVSVRADKTALNDLIGKVEALDLTAEEEALFADALASAKNVSAQELATQAEVNAAYEALYAIYVELNKSAALESVSIVPMNGSDELSGEVIYHKTPWTKAWTSQTVELGFTVNEGVEVASVKWEAANWSVNDPEAKFEGGVDGNTTTVRPTFGVGPRSFWVQVTVTDIRGNTVTSAPVKVRFYNWDWQK